MTQQLNISDSTAMLHDAGFQRIMNAFGLTPSRTHLPPRTGAHRPFRVPTSSWSLRYEQVPQVVRGRLRV